MTDVSNQQFYILIKQPIMALLNLTIAQILLLFVATNTLRKLKPSILFLRWLAAGGLTCYKVPEYADLRKLQYKETTDSTAIKRNQQKSSKNARQSTETKTHDKSVFRIKSADLIKLRLERGQIQPIALESMPLGGELEWTVDFALLSIVSLLTIELFFRYGPKTSEYNFSLLWSVQVILQCLNVMLQLTRVYFKNEPSVGERSVCIVAACIFLVLAILVMNFDGDHLELGLNKAIETWTYGPRVEPNRSSLLDLDEIDTPPPRKEDRPTHVICIKILVAVSCSLVGVVLTFPGFRFGRIRDGILADPGTSPLKRISYHFNYLSPLVAICLWVPAISREPLKRQPYIRIDDSKFELIRTNALIIINLLRLSLVRSYVESFLQLGVERINQIRYRAGFTTNKEVQMAIACINNYVNIATIQYMFPALTCLFSAITLAALSFRHQSGDPTTPLVGDDELFRIATLRNIFGNQTFVLAAERIVESSRQVLMSDIFENLFNFFTWWFHFAWFCTTSAGVAYCKYITH